MAKSQKSKRASQAPSQPSLSVDIVSDIVCPWCWLGTRYFRQAEAQFKKANPKTDINVTWRPYMLDPTVPTEGVPYRDYMKKKFGDAPDNRFKSMRDHLEAAAPDVGIEFKFDDIPMRPNTRNAHRVLKWAQGQDLGNEAAEALFKAFFQDLEDVGHSDVLIRIADMIGMDADIVASLLKTDKDVAAIDEEIQFFRGLGISGVPTFIYNGQYAVQGGQLPEAHIQVMTEAAKTTSPEF